MREATNLVLGNLNRSTHKKLPDNFILEFSIGLLCRLCTCLYHWPLFYLAYNHVKSVSG